MEPTRPRLGEIISLRRAPHLALLDSITAISVYIDDCQHTFEELASTEAGGRSCLDKVDTST